MTETGMTIDELFQGAARYVAIRSVDTADGPRRSVRVNIGDLVFDVPETDTVNFETLLSRLGELDGYDANAAADALAALPPTDVTVWRAD